MSSKFVLTLGLVFVLLGVSGSVIKVERIEASGTIYIRANGLVEGTDKIKTADNVVYVFTDGINDSIVVERDNIIIDGAGYTLQGSGGYGFYLDDRDDVIIKNTNILGFFNGIDVFRSRDCTIIGNNITNNYNGIHIHFFCSWITVKDNNITNNTNFGITIYGDSVENVVYHNNFINNYQHAYCQDIITHHWDNGFEGNYWDNYTGIDSNGDGIGDEEYFINANNKDRYPLMEIIPEFPSFLILPLFMTLTSLAIIFYKRKHIVKV